MPQRTTNKTGAAPGSFIQAQPLSVRIVSLIAAFVGGPLLGWLVARILGGVTETGQIFLYLPYILIFFLGYGMWAARVKAIAFNTLGSSLLRVLFDMVIHRKRPQSVQDVLPTQEKLAQMVVQAQKAASSFFIVSVPVAGLAGASAILLNAETGSIARVLLVSSTCLGWGWVLSRLARRGYLPLPEEA